MVITSILNPSNRFFLSQSYPPEFVYSNECLEELFREIHSDNSLTDFDPLYINNIVYFRLNATSASVNKTKRLANDEFVPILNNLLESCIDDYSIYILNQSTICECKPNTSEAIRERVNFVNLCDELACSCDDGKLLMLTHQVP